MAKVTRLIDYPNVYNQNISNGDQFAYKKFIKNFATMMKDAGIIRSQDNNQLDIDNIPDLTITFSNANTIWGSDSEGKRSFTHKPLIYVIDLIKDTPIYVSFYFKILMASTDNNSIAKSSYHLGLTISVASSTNGNGSQVGTVNNKFQYISNNYYVNSYSMNEVQTCVYANNTKNSYINYNRDTGVFYLEILPNFSQGTSAYSSSWKGTFINLLITSLPDNNGYMSIIPTSNYTSQYFYRSNKNSIMFHYTDTSTYTDTSYNCFGTFRQITTAYTNGNIVTTPCLYLKQGQTSMDINPKVLVANTNIIGQASGFNYNVKISDTETKSYRSWSSGDTQSGFDYQGTGDNGTTALLFLDE